MNLPSRVMQLQNQSLAIHIQNPVVNRIAESQIRRFLLVELPRRVAPGGARELFEPLFRGAQLKEANHLPRSGHWNWQVPYFASYQLFPLMKNMKWRKCVSGDGL